MSKQKASSSQPSASAPSRRVFLSSIDAVQLVDLLDTHYDDTGGPDGSSYRRLYVQTRAALLEREGDGAVTFATLLDAVEEAIDVEVATRQAGFVVGFECCRQLLLGELDLAALTDAEGRGCGMKTSTKTQEKTPTRTNQYDALTLELERVEVLAEHLANRLADLAEGPEGSAGERELYALSLIAREISEKGFVAIRTRATALLATGGAR